MGDIGYAPMGSGHYILNTGDTLLNVLIGFNDGEYQSNDMSDLIKSNPVDVLATNFGVSEDIARKMQGAQSFAEPPDD